MLFYLFYNINKLQDQNCENEEANTSNNSLRRKLFSNHDDSQDEFHSPLTMSPVKPDTSPITYNLSPPQSGMFFHCTPLRVCINSTLLKVMKNKWLYYIKV